MEGLKSITNNKDGFKKGILSPSPQVGRSVKSNTQDLVNDLLLYASKLPTKEYRLCMSAVDCIRSLERENLILRLKNIVKMVAP